MVKKLFKWMLGLAFLAVVLVALLVIFMDSLLRWAAERQIKEQTGLDVRIGKVETSLLQARFRLENLVLYNTPEFGGTPMVDLPELHIEYDRQGLLERKVHLNLMRLHLAEVNIVEGQSNRFNLTVLEDFLKARVKNEQAPKLSDYSAVEARFGGIDKLVLTVDRIRLTAMKKPADSKVFDIGIRNQVMTNMVTEQDVADQLVKVAFERGAKILMQDNGSLAVPPPPVKPVPAKR